MRLLASILIGALIPTLAVVAANRMETKPRWAETVLAPGRWVADQAGPVPTRGVGPSGRPIERPTSRHAAYGMAGILLTIFLYTALAYSVITLIARLSARSPTRATE